MAIEWRSRRGRLVQVHMVRMSCDSRAHTDRETKREMMTMLIRWFLSFMLLVSGSLGVQAQTVSPRALDNYAVTVPNTAVVALTGPTNGCNITSSVALIIDTVGAAGTSGNTTSQLVPATSAFKCVALSPGVQVSVNCSGGGTCSWWGVRW